MRGHAALDYMVIAAFALALIIPVFYYAITYSSESIVTAQAQDAANTIAKAADNTYSLGEGSLSRVQVNIPTNVDSIAINQDSVVFTITTTSGTSNILAQTRSPLNGSISTDPGIKSVVLNNTGPLIEIREA